MVTEFLFLLASRLEGLYITVLVDLIEPHRSEVVASDLKVLWIVILKLSLFCECQRWGLLHLTVGLAADFLPAMQDGLYLVNTLPFQ